MQINNIKIENYRKFESINIDFNSTMNVIVGNNGVGKTTILDAVAIGIGSIFLGIESTTSPGIKKEDVRYTSKKIGSVIDRQPQFPVIISCSGEMNKSSVEWTRQLITGTSNTRYGEATQIKKLAAELQARVRKGDESVVLPIVSYYGTGRLWAKKQESSKKNIDNRLQGYTDCLSAETNEKLMLKWFEKMTYDQLQNGVDLPELQAVTSAIEECYVDSGVEADDVKVIFDVKSHQLVITYHDEKEGYQKHPFHELSDGYRNTLSLIADIAYRMAVLNPPFLGEVTKRTPGVVLIDEVDLHLHPIWQKRILKTLKKVFPLVQFIVTTHSPTIISSAKAEELLILDGDSCKRFDYEVYGKDANSVLTEIMGTTERPDEIAKLFSEFDNFMDNEDYDSAEEVLNKLKKELGEDDSGVASASVALSFRKDWRD